MTTEDVVGRNLVIANLGNRAILPKTFPLPDPSERLEQLKNEIVRGGNTKRDRGDCANNRGTESMRLIFLT